MNWIERMYELKGKDLYSQNGEGILLEYILSHIKYKISFATDIGGGDGFYLSNTRHLRQMGFKQIIYDLERGYKITADSEEVNEYYMYSDVVSIDIDGNDYWILEKVLSQKTNPRVVVAEFNPAFTDSRTIVYNPDHVWAGDDYYGFSFDAGVKLAQKHGYKVIFQVADMNMFMVRADLIGDLYIPPVTFKQSNFFKKSERTDWVMI